MNTTYASWVQLACACNSSKLALTWPQAALLLDGSAGSATTSVTGFQRTSRVTLGSPGVTCMVQAATRGV